MPFKRTNGKADSPYKYRPCVIAVDQSYARSGIAIAVDGILKVVTSVDFKLVKTKTAKRLLLKEKVEQAIKTCLKKFEPDEIVVLCERVRTFTASNEIRPEVIKSHGALVAYIVDTAAQYGIEVWSSDTRAWKTGVLGTSKPSFEPIQGVTNPQKYGAVHKMIELGFDAAIRRYKGVQRTVWTYDDDAADAGCIALYAFTLRPKLKREF